MLCSLKVVTMYLKFSVIIVQVLWISPFEPSGWNENIFFFLNLGFDVLCLEKFTYCPEESCAFWGAFFFFWRGVVCLFVCLFGGDQDCLRSFGFCENYVLKSVREKKNHINKQTKKSVICLTEILCHTGNVVLYKQYDRFRQP